MRFSLAWPQRYWPSAPDTPGELVDSGLFYLGVSCVMNEYKNDLRGLSAAELRSRRDRLAADLPDAGQFLAGSLVEQRRRCGKEGCRCARGELHGPYVYLSISHGSDKRLLYVPTGLAELVRQ